MKVIEALTPNPKPEINHQYLLLHYAMDILSNRASDLKLRPPAEILPLISDLWDSDNETYKKTANQFVMKFTMDRK